MSEQDAPDPGTPGERRIEGHLANLLIEALGANEQGEASEEAAGAARALVRDAVRERATDIHLDPAAKGIRVRMRIDGVMRDAALLVPEEGHRLINQLKTLAGIDPVTQLAADEARFTCEHEEGTVDVRLRSTPVWRPQWAASRTGMNFRLPRRTPARAVPRRLSVNWRSRTATEPARRIHRMLARSSFGAASAVRRGSETSAPLFVPLAVPCLSWGNYEMKPWEIRK